ncbi:hypothetical protein NDU88_010050 [Pleurodeles waltl]|uniref:Uncharacterized protein n=1 Tax=Pleurodeles waltl TaxID=8319 RepID=A0AAV7RXV3_PLEWA|nr:hypothetical protein NDU88_010050 [Pleurodeles waltl]
MGTLITALRGYEKVTRNILWFLKVNLTEAFEEEPEVEGSMWEAGRDNPNTQVNKDSGAGVRPGSQNQQGLSARTDQQEAVPLRSWRYHRRPKAQPTQRLRDFAC